MTYAGPAQFDVDTTLAMPAIIDAPDVARLASGGFVVVGEGASNIRGGIYEATGALVRNIAATGRDPSVAQLSDGNIVIVSEDADSILLRIVDEVTGVEVVATKNATAPKGQNADVAGLSGGGFVIANQVDFSSDSDIQLEIWSNAGVYLRTIVVTSELTDDHDPTVTALDNGNIAVAWVRTDHGSGDVDVMYAVYTPDGVEVVGPTVAGGAKHANFAPSIAAADGGFAIAYEFHPSTAAIWLHRFTSGGVSIEDAPVTAAFVPGLAAEGTGPNLSRGADGNLLVVYTDGDGSVQAVNVLKGGHQFDASNAVDFPSTGTHGVGTAFGVGQVAVFTDTGSGVTGGRGHGFRDGSDSGNTNDRAAGDDFLDIMNGGGGRDTLSGGGNDDEVKGDNNADLLHGDAGNDTVNGAGDTGDDRSPDTLFGDDGNDLLLGAGGADTMHGGEGNDRIFGHASDIPDENAADTLFGDDGDDTLDGGGGADRMEGGTGSDAYVVDNAGDTVVEVNDPGIDSVSSSVTLTLGDFLENLTLTGGGAITGMGNALNNVLTGNAAANSLVGGTGNDTLTGSGGIDTLNGGAGDDTYVDPAGDVISENAGAAGGVDTIRSTGAFSLAALPNIENLVIAGGGNSNATGNAANNAITGGTGANLLRGEGGNDTLSGGAGTDTLNGGGGNDTYVNPGSDAIVEAAGVAGGTDTVETNVAFSLVGIANVERLFLTGSGNLNGTGNELDNQIHGNGGNNLERGGLGQDLLEGGGGNDTLAGEGGNDTLKSGAGSDVLRFAATGAGADTVQDFVQGADRFDLSGGSFSAVSEAGGNTTLTHNGGTIVVIGVTGLTIGQWNALASGPALFAPESAVLQGMPHYSVQAWPAHAQGDFLFV